MADGPAMPARQEANIKSAGGSSSGGRGSDVVDAAARRPAKLETQMNQADGGARSKSLRSTSLSPNRVTNGAAFSVAPPLKQPSAKARSASHARVPASRVQVGTAPPPNLGQVKSRIGSMDNVKHRPQGGRVKVETQKLDWTASSRIGSMENANHRPGGGDKKIPTQKVCVKAQSKIGSLENASHRPGGGNVKVESRKLDFKQKAHSKVGSMDNVKHVPGGGNVQIFDQKYAAAAPKRASSACSEASTNDQRSLPQTPTPQTDAPLTMK